MSFLSVVYGFFIASLGGPLFHNDPEIVPYHVLQARALLNGKLSLANSLDDLHPGLAWHNGEVQQVWGLGTAIWIMPFQAVWSLLGGSLFPDRLALAFAFVLLGIYTGSLAMRLARNGDAQMGIGIVAVVLFSGPLWTLAQGSRLVYEETVLYGVLVSLAVFVSLLRFVLFNKSFDFWLCCLFGGLAGMVRPTVAVYGVSGLILCVWIGYLRKRNLLPQFLGIFLAVAGLASIAISNQYRFGSPFEFGHRLTVSSEEMVYITRFGNSYGDAGSIAAAKELLAALFFSPRIPNEDTFGSNVLPGLASQLRWRHFNMTTFGFDYLVICISSVGAFAWSLVKCRRETGQTQMIFRSVVFLWSIISFSALFAFYLHYPSIMSRYLMDFLPALSGLAFLAWTLLSPYVERVAVVFLGIWLSYGIAIGEVAVPSAITQPSVSGANTSEARPINSFNGIYTISEGPALTVLPFNGQGWDEETGIADDIVTLMVDKPEFLELYVSERIDMAGNHVGEDAFNAMVDGQALHLRLLEPEEGGFRVLFDMSNRIQEQNQDQVLFLCFSEKYQLRDRQSKRFLYSVRWR